MIRKCTNKPFLLLVFPLIISGFISGAQHIGNPVDASYSGWTKITFNSQNPSHIFHNWYTSEITQDVLDKGKVLIYCKTGEGNVQRLVSNNPEEVDAPGYYTYPGIIQLYVSAGNKLREESRFRYVVLPEKLLISGQIDETTDFNDYGKVKAAFGLPD